VCVVAAHTGLSPVMLQVGFAIIGTCNVQLPGQPSRVMLSVSVNEPSENEVTSTEAPSVGPMMVPVPVIDQL
jgi:hypothetical protein